MLPFQLKTKNKMIGKGKKPKLPLEKFTYGELDQLKEHDLVMGKTIGHCWSAAFTNGPVCNGYIAITYFDPNRTSTAYLSV